MKSGNLISPSHRSSLPPWPLVAAFFPFCVGGLLRRVASLGFQLLLSCMRPMGRLSFFGFHHRCAPVTARVPRGRYHAAFNRRFSYQGCVSLSGTQAPALRINAASHLLAVCGILLSIMLMPSPAPNPAVKWDAEKAAVLRAIRLARRPLLLR